MKKIIFIISILLTVFNANAVNLDIINSSFNDSTEIARSSQQWIDVTITGGTWTSSTRFRIFINHISSTGTQSNMQILLNEQFDTYFLNLPFNGDGISRRVYFDIPIIYDDGKFSIDLLTVSIKYGLLDTLNITGIKNPQFNINEEHPQYFTLSGIEVINPIQGYYIRIEGIKKEIIFIP